MEFQHRSCTIHATAGIDNGALMASARIYSPTTDGYFADSHDMEFRRDFLDEHEAISFALEGAVTWIDEHWDAEMDRPIAV
jgi:hypothetical protein